MIIAPDDPGPASPEDVLAARVVRVFDGDGFLADVWHPFRQAWVPRISFRFAFIDAPELGQPFGAEAGAFLESLIGGKQLHLAPVEKESTGVPIDPYRRLLCIGRLTEQMEIGPVQYYRNGACSAGVVKTARPATRNVELEMIVNGWAWVVERYTFEREADYLDAQEDARRNRRGLWRMDNPEPPWVFKRRKEKRDRGSESQHKLF